MLCTRCGFYDKGNRKYKFSHINIVANELISAGYFLCERCEEYAYRSLDDLNSPASPAGCQYCGNEEVKDYQGLNFAELIVIAPSGRRFPAGYRAKLHRECAGYIFNTLPVRYDGRPLPEKWFSPRRPYIARYDDEHEHDDD